MLPENAIKEFKSLYRHVFGIELSEEEAAFRANNLVRLYGIVYGNNNGSHGHNEETEDL